MVTMYSRPRLRAPTRRTRWNLVATAVALVALALTLTRSCSAFASGLRTTVSPKAAGPSATLQWQAAAPVDALPGADRTSGGAAWQCLGCAALFLASAVRHAQSGKAQKPRHTVTACKAAQAPAFAPAPAAPAQVPAPRPEVMLIDLTASEAPAVAKAPAPPMPSSCGGHLVNAAVAEVGAPAILAGASVQAAPQARRRASAGRFLGGARHARARSGPGRRAAAAQRTARRSFGARLQSAPPVPEVRPLPFDPSCLETRIQMGLRTSSCFRSARGREVKTPSASKASSESTGVYLKGIHFADRSRCATSLDEGNQPTGSGLSVKAVLDGGLRPCCAWRRRWSISGRSAGCEAWE
uniref:Uncharacterized protein n=1 Tax=Alexandrium monilatum TaxID=311494 RepID=A0A7S4SR13_9DINO